MQPHISSHPLPKSTPREGARPGGFYTYRGSKPFPQPNEKPKELESGRTAHCLVLRPTVLRSGTQRGMTHPPVVYYMASELGGVVKIGCTVNLVKRLHDMNRGRAIKYHVLGIEDGDEELERRRHLEFRPLAQRADFFWATPEFLALMEERVDSPQRLLAWADGSIR